MAAKYFAAYATMGHRIINMQTGFASINFIKKYSTSTTIKRIELQVLL